MFIACIFATHGVDVIVATDGKTWPSTKRASFKRGADKEHAWIQCMMAKSEMAKFYRAIINLPRKSLKMEHFIIWKENAAGNVINWQFFKLLMDKIQYTQQLPLVGKDLSQSCNETSQSHDGVAFNFWCSRGYYVIQFAVYARIMSLHQAFMLFHQEDNK